MALFSINNVKAASCNYKEQAKLNKEAANVHKEYEFVGEDQLNYHFKIYLTNITDNLRLVVTNNYNDQELNITKQDLVDGVYTIETKIATRKVKYNIEMYATTGDCAGEKLISTSITTPRYNPYSTSYICKQVPDYKYCGIFVDTSKITYAKFIENGEKYKQSLDKEDTKEKSLINKIFSFLDGYKWYFIICIIGIGLLIGIIILKNKFKVSKRGF